MRVFSPTKVNEARFGYNSLYNNIAQQLAGVRDVDAEIGAPVKVTDPNSWGVPSIQLSNNLTSFGNDTSSPFTIDDKVFQVVDNFSWIDRQALAAVGRRVPLQPVPAGRQRIPARPVLLQRPVHRQPEHAVTGYSGADFLQGYMNNAIIAVALVSSDFRNSEWAAYIDDTWKVTPHADHQRRSALGSRAADAGRLRPRREFPAERPAAFGGERRRT